MLAGRGHLTGLDQQRNRFQPHRVLPTRRAHSDRLHIASTSVLVESDSPFHRAAQHARGRESLVCSASPLPDNPGQGRDWRATIQVTTNRVACAYIDVRRSTPDRTRLITAGLIDGTTRSVVRARSTAGWFRNFLAVAGVHGGSNRLDLIVAQPADGVIGRVVFYADSYIQEVRTGPSVLRVGADLNPTTVVMHRTSQLSASVSVVAGATPGRIALLVRPRSNIVRILGSSRRVIDLRPRRRATVTFRVLALRRGRSSIDLLASSSTASSGTTVRVAVVVRR